MIFQKKSSGAKGGEEEKAPDNSKKLLEDLKKCQEDLARIEKERLDFLAGWQRERADFLNYKKEQAETFKIIEKSVSRDLILKILPILDSIEIALFHLPENFKENEWVKGIIKIKEQFKDILKNQGVEEIKTEDEKFNPEFHEAVEKVESEKEDGVIIEEIQKGYLMEGKVLRPARVKVAVKPEKPKEENPEQNNKQP